MPHAGSGGIGMPQQDSKLAADVKFHDDGVKIVAEMFGTEPNTKVTRDRKVSQTGNVAIEIECYGDPSGISVTEADRWIFLLSGEEYNDEVAVVISVDRLRRLVNNPKYSRLRGGDNNASLMVLVPVKDLLERNPG